MGLRGVKIPGYERSFGAIPGAGQHVGRPSLAALGAAGGPASVGWEALRRAGTDLIAQGLETQTEEESRLAALKGGLAAEAAFQDGQPQGIVLRDDGTIAGAAFDKALAAGYIAKLDLVSSEFAQKLAFDHPADPMTFLEKWKVRGAEWTSTLPADLQPAARLHWEEKGAKTAVALRRAEHENALAEANGAIIKGMDQYQAEAATAWRQGDAKAALSPEESWRASLAARTDLSPQSKAKAETDFKDEMRRHAVLGAFEGAKKGGLAGAETFIKKFDDPKAHTDLHPDLKDRITREMSHDLGQLKAEHRLQVADLREQARDALWRLDRGWGATNAGQLAARAKALGEAKLAGELGEAARAHADLEGLSRLPIGEQGEAVKRFVDKAKTSTDAFSAGLAEKAMRQFDHAKKEFAADPIGHAIQTGQAKIQPVDPADAQSLSIRARDAEKLAAFHGIPYALQPFTKPEAENLAAAIETSPREAKVELLGKLAKGLGPRHFAAAIEQLAPKAPAFAHAGALAQEGRPDLASELLFGNELRRNLGKGEDGKPRQYVAPNDASLRTAFAKAFPAELLGELAPDLQAQIQTGALDLYAAKSFRAGKADQAIVDQKRLDEAVRDFTGGVVKWNGKPLLAPLRGQDQASFEAHVAAGGEDLWKGFFRADAADPNGKPRPVEGRLVQDHASLKSLGNGRYLVALADRYLTDDLGRPRILDLRAGSKGP